MSTCRWMLMFVSACMYCLEWCIYPPSSPCPRCMYRPDSGMEKSLASTQNQCPLHPPHHLPPPTVSCYQQWIQSKYCGAKRHLLCLILDHRSWRGHVKSHRISNPNHHSVLFECKNDGSHLESVWPRVFCGLTSLKWEARRLAACLTVRFIIFSWCINCVLWANQTGQPKLWLKHNLSFTVLSSISKVACECLLNQSGQRISFHGEKIAPIFTSMYTFLPSIALL